MTDRQRENTAKFLYDMAKGVALIAVVGGLAGGQTSGWAVIFGLIAMAALFALAYWMDGRVGQDV